MRTLAHRTSHQQKLIGFIAIPMIRIVWLLTAYLPSRQAAGLFRALVHRAQTADLRTGTGQSTTFVIRLPLDRRSSFVPKRAACAA